MKNFRKKYVLLGVVALLVLVIAFNTIGSVSAASGKAIDKGIAPHKNDKSVNVNWTAKIYNNNKLEVIRYFSKNNTVYKIEKSTFNRVSKGKLKVFTVTRNNETIIRTNKYMKIKNSESIKSYYLNVHKPKILKGIITSKSFDYGSGYLSNVAHGSFKWNARVYYNNKVFIKEDVNGISEKYIKHTYIERIGKGKLKITTTHYFNYDFYDFKLKKVVNSTKIIAYVKSQLSPVIFYLKVYKPKMTKYFSEDSFVWCISPIEIHPDAIIRSENAYANLKDSLGKMEWTVNQYYNGKVEIIRNYTDNSFLNVTTLIEQFNISTIKISIVFSNGNNSTEINYVDYSSNPYSFYLDVYKPEMLKQIKGDITYYPPAPLYKFTNHC
jgi:hypothetical protein